MQTEEVLLSLDETLAQAGVSKNNLVSVTIYLADMVGFAAMNEA
ncbi:Rid family hydrolase, partial [Bosea sp. Root483D1]